MQSSQRDIARFTTTAPWAVARPANACTRQREPGATAVYRLPAVPDAGSALHHRAATLSPAPTAGLAGSGQGLTANCSGQTLIIMAPAILDFTCYRNFRACYEQASAVADYYVVDLAGTDTIDSSGLAMLLLLRDHAGGNRDRVCLLRASPALRSVLLAVHFDSLFSLDA